MSNKKQTAVEWYEIEINSLFKKYEEKEISYREFITMKHNLFYKAKELEKQQIIYANNDGYKVGRKRKKFETAEQYYTQTYEN